MFTFQLVLGQGAYWEVFWYHIEEAIYWLLLCSHDVWSFGGDIFWGCVRMTEQPNFVQQFIESSKNSYSCRVYHRWNTCIIKYTLDAIWIPQHRKKWNTVQSLLSCRSHQFIWTDFIHLSIVPFLTSSGWKNIYRCSCVGIEKFRLPIR